MNIKTILTTSFATVALLSSCNSGDLNIKVKDADEFYRFTAIYDEQKTPRVNAFINRSIAPTSIVSDEDIDVTTVLDDKTKFKWESSPGKMMIYLDKDENSRASYQRIKSMCQGAKEIMMAK
jgi:hypothetical protein